VDFAAVGELSSNSGFVEGATVPNDTLSEDRNPVQNEIISALQE
jgi:hypothetical protein